VKPDLSVKIGKLKLKNPVMAASGTFGDGYGELTDIRSLGAIVAKTVTLRPRIGNPPPRVIETPSGMLNSIGLENKGVDIFLKKTLPSLKKFGTPVIASIAGDDEDEFKELAKAVGTKAAALELNLSCPNIRYGGKDRLIAQDEKGTYETVKAVRRATGLTVIAKLSPNVTDISRIAKAAEEAGADAVSLVNTFLGMAVDIEAQRPVLGNVTGGLSGPAIKPLALRMVWTVYNKVRIPVIGMGGIMDHKDALEFMLAGAAAIQVGTANFVDPGAAAATARGIEEYMKEHGIENVKGIVGKLRTG